MAFRNRQQFSSYHRLGWLLLGGLLMIAPSSALALLNWDPGDLDAPMFACAPELEVVGQPRLEGHRFVGQTLTIDAAHVKIINRDGNCATYQHPLINFTWGLVRPADSAAVLQADTSLTPQLFIDAAGEYTVQLFPCAPDGCSFIVQGVPGSILVAPQPARAITFVTTSQLAPETVPVLPPSALQSASPAFFTKDRLKDKCSDNILPVFSLFRDALIPQLVTVEDWLGPQDYANFNAATNEVEAVEGFILKSKIAAADNVLNHHSNDTNFNLFVDPIHRKFLMIECEEDKPCPQTGQAPTRSFLHNEWETDEFPEPFRPSMGDRASFFGFWVHDCGHAPFETEIHPPVGVAAHRRRAIHIPSDRFFPSLGGTVGSNVVVPGILTEVWFNRFGGEMMGDNTGLAQPCCGGGGILYTCPDGTTQITLDCLGGIGEPFEIEAEQQLIFEPAPWERVFTFNVYLPASPKAVLESIGVTNLPEVPLYYEVLTEDEFPFDKFPVKRATRILPSDVNIERVDEAGLTFLRVRVNLVPLPGAFFSPRPRFFRMVAAWVYPAPDNWGLRHWRVTVHSMDVENDRDGESKGDGEWHLWLGVNNASAEDRFFRHEWTKIIDRDIGAGHHDLPDSTGSGGLLGPDLALFPDAIFPDQKIHVVASGYEDDTWRNASLGLIAERHDQVGRSYSIPSIGVYTLNYEIIDLGPGEPAILSEEAQQLREAYDLSGLQCPPGDDVCVPVLNSLPPPARAVLWHPQDEPLPPNQPSGSIFETALYEPQEVEEGVFLLHQSPNELFEQVVAVQQADPVRLDRLMKHLREEVDEALVTIGSEVLVDVHGLRASLPRHLWQRYFGDLPQPQSPPGMSPRRMTGAGRVRAADGAKSSFEINLHCNPVRLPNKIKVTWAAKQRFDLDLITAVACDEEPVPMHTHRGEGVGRLNGVPGATAEWAFEDAGEPGREDSVRLLVKDVDGQVVLDLDTTIDAGNLKAHER